jgi:hypothetical protein
MKQAYASILLVSLVACGLHTSSDDSSFEVRTHKDFVRQAEIGGLTLTLENALPEVSVPDPHTPTVFHLNATVCSVPPQELVPQAPQGENESAGVSQDGALQQALTKDGNEPTHDHAAPSLAGEKKCLSLSPTLFAKQKETYVLTAAEVNNLINGDYTDLRVEFQSSAQVTSLSFTCSPKAFGRVTPRADAVNALNVKVVQRAAMWYECQ